MSVSKETSSLALREYFQLGFGRPKYHHHHSASGCSYLYSLGISQLYPPYSLWILLSYFRSPSFREVCVQ